MVRKNISIGVDTWNALASLGKFGQTFDDIIKILLQEHEEFQHKRDFYSKIEKKLDEVAASDERLDMAAKLEMESLPEGIKELQSEPELKEFIKEYSKQLKLTESETQVLLKAQAKQYNMSVVEWARYVKLSDKIHNKMVEDKQKIVTEEPG